MSAQAQIEDYYKSFHRILAYIVAARIADSRWLSISVNEYEQNVLSVIFEILFDDKP